jgi:hypothetical protein
VSVSVSHLIKAYYPCSQNMSTEKNQKISMA